MSRSTGLRVPSVVGAALAALLVAAAPAGAVSYTEDFEVTDLDWNLTAYSDLESLTWETDGGADGGRYLRITRTHLQPIFQPEGGQAEAMLHGDLGATFGSLIDFSYFVQIFDDVSNGQVLEDGWNENHKHSFFSGDLRGPLEGITIWTRVVATEDQNDLYRGGWNEVSFTIDTTWTDEEAIAHGWSLFRGTASWASTLADVSWQQFFTGDGGSAAAGQISHTTGFDLVRVESATAPEPAGLALAALLAALGARRRPAPRSRVVFRERADPRVVP